MLYRVAARFWLLSDVPENFRQQYRCNRSRHYRCDSQCHCAGKFLTAYAKQRRRGIYAVTVGEVDGQKRLGGNGAADERDDVRRDADCDAADGNLFGRQTAGKPERIWHRQRSRPGGRICDGASCCGRICRAIISKQMLFYIGCGNGHSLPEFCGFYRLLSE